MPRTVMSTSQECRKLIPAAPSRRAFLENLLEQLLDGTIVAQGKAIRSSAIDRLKGSPRQRVQDEPIPPEFWDLEVLSDPKSWISGEFSNPNSHDEWFGETVGQYNHVRFPANKMRPVLKPVVKLDPLAPLKKRRSVAQVEGKPPLASSGEPSLSLLFIAVT